MGWKGDIEDGNNMFVMTCLMQQASSSNLLGHDLCRYLYDSKYALEGSLLVLYYDMLVFG